MGSSGPRLFKSSCTRIFILFGKKIKGQLGYPYEKRDRRANVSSPTQLMLVSSCYPQLRPERIYQTQIQAFFIKKVTHASSIILFLKFSANTTTKTFEDFLNFTGSFLIF